MRKTKPLLLGYNNIAIGPYAGWHLTSGSFNFCLGRGCDVPDPKGDGQWNLFGWRFKNLWLAKIVNPLVWRFARTKPGHRALAWLAGIL